MGYRYNAITGELNVTASDPIPDDYANEFVTDSGTAIPSAHVINFLGDATQGISSSGAGNTVTYTIADSSDSQKGVSELATDAEAIQGTDTTRTIVPAALNAKLGSLTSNSLPFGQGSSSAIGWTSALTDGQIVIGATGMAPASANIISSDGSIAVGNGANSIDLTVTGSVPTSYPTDSGTAVPSGGELQVVGGTNMNTSGASNIVTINLDRIVAGLTSVEAGDITISGTTIATTAMNNDINIDPHGSGSIILTTTAGGNIDLDNLRINTNTLSSTDTDGAIILDPDGTGTVQIAYGTENAVLVFGASGAISEIGPLTDGQLVIGSTGMAPVAASLTSTGGTITITPGAGSINLETDATVATSYTTDSGSAVPALGILQVLGGTGCATGGATNVVTINLDAEVPLSFPTDAGTATPAANALTVAGGTLLNTSGAGAIVTVNADDNVVGSVVSDAGTATPTSNSFTIAGGTGCSTGGAAATITVNLDAEVPLSFPTDSGTATPATNALTVAGGTNMNTAGASSTVTVNLDTTLTGLTSVTSTTFLGTTFDTNVAAAGVTLAGTTLAADGTDANIDIEITPKGTGVLLTGAIGNAADTTAIDITAAGEVTMPLQPAVVARNSTSPANVTGDGTGYTMVYDTERIDQGGDWDGTSTYTAPVTGNHWFFQNIMVGGIGAQTDLYCTFTVTALAIFYGTNLNPTACQGTSNAIRIEQGAYIDLDAADTVTATLVGAGSTKTLSINGVATATYIGIALLS